MQKLLPRKSKYFHLVVVVPPGIHASIVLYYRPHLHRAAHTRRPTLLCFRARCKRTHLPERKLPFGTEFVATRSVVDHLFGNLHPTTAPSLPSCSSVLLLTAPDHTLKLDGPFYKTGQALSSGRFRYTRALG